MHGCCAKFIERLGNIRPYEAVGFRRGRRIRMVRGEIERLEKTVHTLARLPWLIRREYWVSQIEHLLEATTMSIVDRRRLTALLEQFSSMPTGLRLPQYERTLAIPAHSE
jgi:hypothetical protein